MIETVADGLQYQTAEPNHIPFIAGTFVKSYRKAAECAGWADDDYYPWAKLHVAKLIANSLCLVAVDPVDTDNIAGYILYYPPFMHWAYVRKDWRNNNVFSRLREYSQVHGYSHRSHQWHHERGGLVYRPWWSDQ